MLAAVCLIDLKDGSSRHVWAIQVPNRAKSRTDTKARQMVVQLNDRLQAEQQLPS